LSCSWPSTKRCPVDAWNDSATGALVSAAIAALARHHPLDIKVRRMLSPKFYAERMNLFESALYGRSSAAG
jgi:hypothetical protein